MFWPPTSGTVTLTDMLSRGDLVQIVGQSSNESCISPVQAEGDLQQQKSFFFGISACAQSNCR